MSPSNQLSRDELLEMAELDALGVLDEYEQALFTRALSSAASALQEEVRNLQASFVADMSLLPNEEPDPSLKHSVLAAVAHAIDEENEQLAPLATIGMGSRRTAASRGGDGVATSRVYLWRAATFALAAGLLVSLFFLGRLVETNKSLTEKLVGDHVIDDITRIAGIELTDMFNRRHTARALVDMTGRDGDAPRGVSGVILIDDQRKSATLLVFGCPTGASETYSIRVLDAEGRAVNLDDRVVQRSDSTTAVAHIGKILPRVLEIAQLGTIQLIDSTGAVVMQTA